MIDVIAGGQNLTYLQHDSLIQLETNDNLFPELDLTPWVKDNWKEKK
jgi:hypothetical protein